MTQEETATFIYKEGELVGIIKRDEKSKKHLVYVAHEAKTEEIARFIAQNAVVK